MADFNQILSVASLRWGKGCLRFWGRSDQNCGYHGNRNSHWHIIRKTVSPDFSVTFNWIFVKLAGNEDRHKISEELEFGPGWTFHYWVVRPWAFPLTLNGENGVSIFTQLLWSQSSSNLQVTRTGIKARSSSNFSRIWPVILELRALEWWKKKDFSSFSQSPLIGSLSNLQVMRTGIKARTSSNLGRIRQFTLELYALERGFFPHRLMMGKS